MSDGFVGQGTIHLKCPLFRFRQKLWFYLHVIMYVEKLGNIYELTCILLETLLLHILDFFLFVCSMSFCVFQ